MGKTWFKHYASASQGNSLRLLWDAKDYEAYGLWWRLLELLTRWEKPEAPGQVTLSWDILARETNWKPSKCRRVLSRISSVSQIELNEKQDGTFEFLLPNYIKLQERRGGKRDAKKFQNAGRSKKEEVRGKIENNQNATSSLHPLADLWNKNRGPLPEVRGMGKTRKRLADARWSENPVTEYWSEIISRMARSAFCRGEKNDPNGEHANWKANFDFLVKPDTHIRVSEGKYDDRSTGGSSYLDRESA